MIRFDADASLITAEAGDATSPPRIAGVAVPWDTVATVSGGQQVSFARGAFDVTQKPAKLLENHDMTQLRGVVNALADTETGLEFEATLADTRASRDAVALLQAGAYDSVSVGAQPIRFTTSDEGVMQVTEAALVELSLVAVPAFSGAVITEVAATAADPEPEDSDSETNDEGEPEVSDASEATPVEATATIPTNPILYTRVKAELPTAAEYLSAFLTGGARWDSMIETVQAAAPDVTTDDAPGILPTPILGPVYNNFLGRRPVVDAIGTRAMPGGGKVFIRPKVTTHASMAVQSSEISDLQDGTLVVDDLPVTKGTFGGYVQLSEQAIDWTDPAILNVLLDDMARVYATTTNAEAAGNLESGATNTVTFDSSSTDPTDWAEFVGEAAASILSDSNGNLPTHLFMATDVWQVLLGLSDDSKRPLFPNLGPMNAFGALSPGSDAGSAFGLQVVVDGSFSSGTLIMGDASGFEIYEQQKGAIQASNPANLSTTIAFRGYFATLMLDVDKFVKATAAP